MNSRNTDEAKILRDLIEAEENAALQGRSWEDIRTHLESRLDGADRPAKSLFIGGRWPLAAAALIVSVVVVLAAVRILRPSVQSSGFSAYIERLARSSRQSWSALGEEAGSKQLRPDYPESGLAAALEILRRSHSDKALVPADLEERVDPGRPHGLEETALVLMREKPIHRLLEKMMNDPKESKNETKKLSMFRLGFFSDPVHSGGG